MYSATSHEAGGYTVDLLAGWFPGFLRPAVRLGVRSMLDDRIGTPR